MSRLPDVVDWLEADDALQLGRILVLLQAFSGRKHDQPIEGLTKLAKLDFLLRYPAYLEEALIARNADGGAASVEDFERTSVEAHMVRYRYGPWDHRYRQFLNTLIGLGLVEVQTTKRTILIRPTEAGQEAATALATNPAYRAMAERAKLLKRHLNLGATALMEFIYATFPQVVSLRIGQTIDP
jgi:hypothetical protein